jgi:hypothetical protein
MDMFQMVTGDSCQRMKISIRHAACTVPGCAFVARYQNTSNLENHYVTAGTDHKELADRLNAMQHSDKHERLGYAGHCPCPRTITNSTNL